MTGKRRYGNPVAVSDIATGILDPVMRKRAGLSVELVQSWAEIVGERLALSTQPEKLAWPRRRHEDDPFEPATLVIACEGAAALRLQHETGEVIGRVNAFLGFAAVGRVKIVQKPVKVAPQRRPRPKRALTAPENERIDQLTAGIEDDALRQSLQKLGESIARKRG
ncbi:DciA family protein [Nitratireductor aquimarinus]|uniref:DciA family protein n=1 Tax=Nitratireductor aquimarinus TaxID=889300 RepID=A0ABU4AN55_9HYPH|nr:DciA family protein [Nitratireductor aquimarinus]MDV6227672.1 DciA family protein [Nitratireductor aquimarinus]